MKSNNNGEYSISLHDLVSRNEIEEQRRLLQLPDNNFKLIFDYLNECDDAILLKEVENCVLTTYVLMISQGLKIK